MKPIGPTTYDHDLIRDVIAGLVNGRHPFIPDHLATSKGWLTNIQSRLPTMQEIVRTWELKAIELAAEIAHLRAKTASLEKDLGYTNDMAYLTQEAIRQLKASVETCLAALSQDRVDVDDTNKGD